MLSVPVVEGPIGLAGSLERKKMAGYNSYLVGGFNHLEKYEFVNGKDKWLIIPYIMKHVWNH